MYYRYIFEIIVILVIYLLIGRIARIIQAPASVAKLEIIGVLAALFGLYFIYTNLLNQEKIHSEHYLKATYVAHLHAQDDTESTRGKYKIIIFGTYLVIVGLSAGLFIYGEEQGLKALIIPSIIYLALVNVLRKIIAVSKKYNQHNWFDHDELKSELIPILQRYIKRTVSQLNNAYLSNIIFKIRDKRQADHATPVFGFRLPVLELTGKIYADYSVIATQKIEYSQQLRQLKEVIEVPADYKIDEVSYRMDCDEINQITVISVMLKKHQHQLKRQYSIETTILTQWLDLQLLKQYISGEISITLTEKTRRVRIDNMFDQLHHKRVSTTEFTTQKLVKDDRITCNICWNGSTDQDVLIETPCCMTPYHRDHIITWLLKNQICPNCRFPLQSEAIVRTVELIVE